MDEVQRAAILMLGMGETQAIEVLKHMDAKQVEKIILAMNMLGQVTQEEINQALADFKKISENTVGMAIDSSQFIRNTLNAALGKDKAATIIDRTLVDNNARGIDTLRWQDPKAIVSLLRNEHPQVIAVILTHLDSEKSAGILAHFSGAMRADIMRRIALLGSISPQSLVELNEVMEEQSKEVKSFKTLPTAGAKLAANIINFMDNEIESELIKDLSAADEKLSEKIQEYIFPFDRLASIDKRSIQGLLRQISNDILVLALKGVDQNTQNAFFGNMSERAADMLRDDLESKGPVQLSKVIAAQKEVVAIAQRMAQNGEITLGSSGEKMVG